MSYCCVLIVHNRFVLVACDYHYHYPQQHHASQGGTSHTVVDQIHQIP